MQLSMLGDDTVVTTPKASGVVDTIITDAGKVTPLAQNWLSFFGVGKSAAPASSGAPATGNKSIMIAGGVALAAVVVIFMMKKKR